jgi:prolipoprotein diacylglyceryl transferase
VHPLAAIPSPTQAVWHLGPIPLRAYALCIVAGIFVCLWLTMRRWRERGGDNQDVWDVAGWAIVFGVIGGRLYHVVSDPELYFGEGRNPLNAFKIWDGGLGIWGAIALGALGAWIGCRRHGMSLPVFADAAAPGIILAQAIGRWGNWFNNELYGSPTTMPWKLQIHDIDIVTGRARLDAFGHPVVLGYFQPTFLYECLWDVAIALGLILLDRRLRLGRGNVFALYVMGYTAGRVWIEMLRTDHANHILGLRLNVWTCIIVFAGGLAWFLTHGGFRAARETSPYRDGRTPEPHDGGADEVSETAGASSVAKSDPGAGVHGRADH